MKYFYSCLLFFIFLQGNSSYSQDFSETGTDYLDKMLSGKKTQEASNTLQSYINYFLSKQLYDSLPDYTYYVGKLEYLKTNKTKAQNKAEKYVSDLKKLTNKPATIRSTYLSLASFYDFIGLQSKGYESTFQALQYTKQIPNVKSKDLATIYNNLGIYNTRLGKIDLAIKNYRKTIKLYKADSTTSPTDYYFGYSSLGTAMYYSSKIDSAIYYYDKAKEEILKSEKSPVNLYYRPAMLLNNIAGLYSMEGKTTKSLEAMENSIEFYKLFIKSDGEDYKKKDAQKGLFVAIDNIASIYQTVGDYKKALDLHEYSYQQRKVIYENDNPEIFKSKILLGQAHLLLQNYLKAENLLLEGIALINKKSGEFLYWKADANYSLAKLYEAQNKLNKAEGFYTKSKQQFTTSLQGNFDETYLKYLQDASIFYTKIKNETKAIETAQLGFEYVIKHQGSNTLTAFNQTLNLAEVNYLLHNYKKAHQLSSEALKTLKNKAFKRSFVLDSIQLEFKKPNALLIQSQSLYHLNTTKDTLFLQKLFKNSEQAIAILKRRKNIFSDPKSISLLMEENNKIYDFAAKIALEIYFKTKNNKYLLQTISLHEEKIYNRIRSRLNLRSNQSFINIPKSVIEKEKQLKANITNSLTNNSGKENDIQTFFQENEKWNVFLDTLQQKYPEYYKMRYASLNNPLENTIKNIPKNTTLIRFLFIENKLFAVVLDKNQTEIIPLPSEDIKKNIYQLEEYKFNTEKTGKLLYGLYQKLWYPLENKITNKKIIIIPDRELFNLSFESLTFSKINSFKEMATKSLLSKHIISYNYSLFLINNKVKKQFFSNNFIAFVPEFNDKMKNDYVISINDSLSIDKSYLTLLPQPFSVDLAKTYKKYFNGSTFLNKKASKQVFINKANEHKIIHIGTHAESNNLSPDLSRLIFAKNTSDENNSLYTYEIYNQNLSSNLAILTACETGKPTYQPGEGMISLAHAFNYAGSESILTSLWEIDEQSSTQIIDFFYTNLSNGLHKDEALQKAKLEYIYTAEGRTISPQYWAGLVLIGDISPLDLTISKPIYIYLIIMVISFFLFYIFFKRRFKNN